MMFVYSVNLIIFFVCLCSYTWYTLLIPLFILLGHGVSHPVLKEAAILQLVLGCTNKNGVQFCSSTHLQATMPSLYLETEERAVK